MNAVQFLLASFDDIWGHRWESTSSVLEGVTPEEAVWQHPAYADVAQEAGMPGSGTIAWHIAHLEYCTRYYTRILETRSAAEDPADPSVPPPANLSFLPLLELFGEARRKFRDQLAVLTDADLDAECRSGSSVAAFVGMVFRHQSWHGGQIALIRRLYRQQAVAAQGDPAVRPGDNPGTHSEIYPRLHHAQITVPSGSVEEARAFYCGVLAFPEVPKPESLRGRGGFWFRVGDRDVHVGTEDGVDRTETKAHLAYQVANLDEWRTVLKEHGIEALEGIPIPGYNRFEFRDPFGNRVEFIEAKKSVSGSSV